MATAVDSVIGAVAEGEEGALSGASIDLLNRFLLDLIVPGNNLANLTQGEIPGGGSVMTGSNSNGGSVGMVLNDNTPLAGSIQDNEVKLFLTLPAGIGIVFEGNDDVTPANFGMLLKEIIATYGEDNATVQALFNAVDDMVETLEDFGVTNVDVRVIDFVKTTETASEEGSDAHESEVVFNAEGSDAGTVLGFNLATLDQGDTLVLKNVENILLAGDGSVHIDSDSDVLAFNDLGSQFIVSGGGNDTLVGGGGNDTLTGGSGHDTFGFNGKGHYVITDFEVGTDNFAFQIDGISDIGDLNASITRVEQSSAGVTYHFGSDASVTLIGVTASEVTAEMVFFDFNVPDAT